MVWKEASTFLSRRPRADGLRRRKKRIIEVFDKVRASEDWSVPESTGYQYAWISGDWSPIHLIQQSARLFGHRAPIAHGMWAAACCVAQWESLTGQTAAKVEAMFTRPIYLPAKAKFLLIAEPPRGRLVLENAQTGKLHLMVSVAPR